MIAGPAATTGRTFERTVFNDKYPTKDPVTGQALTPVPFHATTQGFSGASGQALPALNLAARGGPHELEHLLGQRVDHQRPARRRRPGDPDRHRRPAASRTASTPRTTAARRTSRSSSRASTTRASATTRTASPPRTRRARVESACPAARSPTTSATRSATRARLGLAAALGYLAGQGCPAVSGSAARRARAVGCGRSGRRRRAAQVALAREPHPAPVSARLSARRCAGSPACCPGGGRAAPVRVPRPRCDPGRTRRPHAPERGEPRRARALGEPRAERPGRDARRRRADHREHADRSSRQRTADAQGRRVNGRETGRPERFHLLRDGPRCVLVHERTGRRFALHSATCQPR